ncbi:MAG: hypothetical protein BGO67_09735 [Alphaproteobacteria bacterium 41-28]|nr:MAG: hypothetical protein BGO67_09735 [Alphaproteobacteria bacterium 41-28]
MTFFKTLTQGGQVHVHQLRMFKQIFMIGSLVAFLGGGGFFLWKAYHLPFFAWQATYEVTWAKFMLATTPVEKHKTLAQLYTPLKGNPRVPHLRGDEDRPYKRKCIHVLKDPILQKITQQMEGALKEALYDSFEITALIFSAIMALWFALGHRHMRNIHQRGATFVPWQKLAALIKTRRDVSDLKLLPAKSGFSKLPLIKGKETSHILITGTTGSGKTNAFHHLLPQIRKRGNRAIILDVTGDYVSRYYNKKKDVILNPLDQRSRPWHPWADCHLDSHYDVLSESFIQTKEGNRDPFWDNASQALLKTALRKYAAQGEHNIEKLTTFLMSASDKEFEDFFKGTEAATFAFKNNDKTTHSIRSVLSSQIEGLRQLESTQEPFSIREWIMNDPPSLLRRFGGWLSSWIPVFPAFAGTGTSPRIKNPGSWLFITARPDQRQTLTPLISAWMDIAINALMVLPEKKKRRLWFVMDELAALQKLPKLQAGLAEGRKYGGCLLAGFQSKPQLEDIYGRNGAETMLDLFNTKIFFRCTEPSTQAWISKVLGDKEEIEPTENISYGANSMRDGVSLSRHTRQTPLIMPTELSQLKDLECYVKYPGDYPCTKLQTKYKRAPFFKKKAFLLKPEKKRAYTVETSAGFENKIEELI